MDINWNKWIIESLPIRLRTEIMSAYCKSLVYPVQNLYDEVNRWQAKMKVKAGGSPQTCMIQKAVKDTLDIDIIILEGDGNPIDFIIQTAFTDTDKERQLFAILDYYKLAGKSYSYENKQVVYNCQWTDYICEKDVASYTQKWSKYICEKGNGDKTNYITLIYYWQYDPNWDATIIKKLRIEAGAAVKSDLVIHADLHAFQSSTLPAKFELKAGQHLIEMNTWVMDRHENERVFPIADYYFNYKLIIKDIYG